MSGGVRLHEIQAPSSDATVRLLIVPGIIYKHYVALLAYIPAQDAELAWHFHLPGLTSGYMYYGGAEDMPVKQTVACNNAVTHANKSITM